MVSRTQVFDAASALNSMFDFVDLFFAVLILWLWIYGMIFDFVDLLFGIFCFGF